MSNPILGKVKNFINLLSAEFAHSTVSVNIFTELFKPFLGQKKQVF